jgi:hypothetical protein
MKNLINELQKHLQLPEGYYLEQDKDDKHKVYVWKEEDCIQELIGYYIFENGDLDEVFELGKEILGDIWG